MTDTTDPSNNVKPLHEVFLGRARGVGHILRDRVWRMTAFSSKEDLEVELLQNPDGTSTLRYHRSSDGDGCIEFANIKPDGLAAVHFGEETTLKSEMVGSISEVIDNRYGAADIAVKFHDLFRKTESQETDKKAGTSVKVSVKSTESIEGVASFEESVEAEAHAEIDESEGESTTNETEGEEGTTVPKGKRVRIVETREKADVSLDVTAHGKFSFLLTVGKHSGGKFVGHQGRGFVSWDSWQDFVDVISGNSPDNWDLAESFKEKSAYRSDLWVLKPLSANVRYVVKFEGRVSRSYTVEVF